MTLSRHSSPSRRQVPKPTLGTSRGATLMLSITYDTLSMSGLRSKTVCAMGLMSEPTPAGTTGPLLLVHGAWHGAWCWSGILDLINPSTEVVALELPFDSIEYDAETLRTALDELGP